MWHACFPPLSPLLPSFLLSLPAMPMSDLQWDGRGRGETDGRTDRQTDRQTSNQKAITCHASSAAGYWTDGCGAGMEGGLAAFCGLAFPLFLPFSHPAPRPNCVVFIVLSSSLPLSFRRLSLLIVAQSFLVSKPTPLDSTCARACEAGCKKSKRGLPFPLLS